MVREWIPKSTTTASASAAAARNKRTLRGNVFPATFSSAGSATLTSAIFVSPTVITFVSSDCLPVVLSMDWLSLLFGRYAGIAFRGPSMQEAENRRNKYQCGNGGTQQTTDDGAAERRVLLASFAQTQRHWNHADDHGQGGHNDRPKPGVSRLNRGFYWIPVMKELFLRERNHKDAICCRYAHAHDRAHQCGDAKRRVRDEQK